MKYDNDENEKKHLCNSTVYPWVVLLAIQRRRCSPQVLYRAHCESSDAAVSYLIWHKSDFPERKMPNGIEEMQDVTTVAWKPSVPLNEPYVFGRQVKADYEVDRMKNRTWSDVFLRRFFYRRKGTYDTSKLWTFQVKSFKTYGHGRSRADVKRDWNREIVSRKDFEKARESKRRRLRAYRIIHSMCNVCMKKGTSHWSCRAITGLIAIALFSQWLACEAFHRWGSLPGLCGVFHGFLILVNAEPRDS
jgi:hypothetical protein